MPSWGVWLSFSLWGRTGLPFSGLVTVLLSYHLISLEGCGVQSRMVRQKRPQRVTLRTSLGWQGEGKENDETGMLGLQSHPLPGGGGLLSSTCLSFLWDCKFTEARLLFSLCNASNNNNNNISFKILFYLSIVDLQSCVNFCCTAKWFSNIYIFHILFCYGLPQDIEYSSLCYTVGEGNGTPLQTSCLENPMDGGAW